MAYAEQTTHPVFWGIDYDATLTRKGEKERPAQPESVPYLMELGTELYNLSNHSPGPLKDLIKKFGIDKWSRLARENDFNEKVAKSTGKKEDEYAKLEADYLYRHNKGMVLELIMPSVMYRLDSPVTSRTNCPVLFQMPYSHTQGGHPDVTVDYGDGFIVYVEVSTNKIYGDGHLKSQLESALEHMKGDKVYWTLLVTPWDYKTSRQSVAYANFMEKNQVDMTEFNIIFLSIKDVARICYILAGDAEIHAGDKNLNSKQMETILSRLRDAQDEYQIEEEDGDDEAGGDDGDEDDDEKDQEDEDEGEEDEEKREDEYKEINLVKLWTDTTKELLNPKKKKKKRTRKKSASAAPAS